MIAKLMKKIRHILSVILISTLLLSGLPLFSPEDASRNNRVDLEDAVLLVRDFARTAEDPAAFTASVQRVVSTMNVLAGLKAVISQTDDTKLKAASVCSDFCLNFLCDVLISQGDGSQIHEKSFFYESVAILPAHRYG